MVYNLYSVAILPPFFRSIRACRYFLQRYLAQAMNREEWEKQQGETRAQELITWTVLAEFW